MTLTAWTPAADQILVRPLLAADRTVGGIIVAEQSRERPQTGVVLLVGPGQFTEAGVRPCSVDVGDLVAFGKYAGITFTLEGEDVLLMRDLEVLARKPEGTFALTEHTIERGITAVTVCHEVGERCEHCPPEPRSDFLEQERARLLAASSVPSCDAPHPDGGSRCALLINHDDDHSDDLVEWPVATAPDGAR